MNTVLSNYGQLCGCPEILKKSCNFFVVGLTYGCLSSWKRKMRVSSWKWKTEHDIIPSRAMVCAIVLFV